MIGNNFPVWVISLERATERRALVSRCLEQIHVPFEFISAVDGRALSTEELNRISDEKRANQHIGRSMTRGEIGCAESHLQAYRQLLESSADAALILEDDIRPDERLLQVVNAHASFPEGWDVIHLNWWGGGRTSFLRRRRLPGGFRLTRFVEGAWSGAAYLITRKAAAQLLALAYPIHVPSDYLLHEHEPYGLKVWGTLPLAVQLDEVLALDPKFANVIDERAAAVQEAFGPITKPSKFKKFIEEALWLKRRFDPRWIP